MTEPVADRVRVLVADDAESLTRLMAHLLTDAGYEVAIASDGEACLRELARFHPALVVLDIMMPLLHGIDTLKRIKADPATRAVKVIICTSKDYKPDLDEARAAGAAAVLVKPFDPDEFIRTVGAVLAATPTPITGPGPNAAGERYLPELRRGRPILRCWGTRGSTPVSGARFIRTGGNTSCVSVESDDQLIIFDAGTGLRELGLTLAGQSPRPIHLFISHTHWDHIQGFPFFVPAYIPGWTITIYSASGFGKDLAAVFRGQLDRDYFPVQLDDMRATLEFRNLTENPITIGNCKVAWEYAQHPGATLGYRLDLPGFRFAYLSDNEFLKGYLGDPAAIEHNDSRLEPYRPLLRFLDGVDLLISEAQYSNQEYAPKIGWGHSSITNACLLTKLAQVREWLITHHDPLHDDVQLQERLLLARQVLADLGHPAPTGLAVDGLTRHL